MNVHRESARSGQKEEELELLLCSTRTALEPAVAAALRKLVRQEPDWSYLISTARKHGVVPLVYRTLRDLEDAHVPADVLRSLRKIFHQWGLAVDVRVAELQSLLTACAEQGISVIPFKGPVLGVCGYGDAALRKPGDLDLLVRKRDFAGTRQVLMEAGYQPEISPEEERAYLEKQQGFSFSGPRCTVDLHWTLEQLVFNGFPRSFKITPEEIWQACHSIDLRGTVVPTLSNEHLLLYLCAHGAKHSWDSLYMICDVAELIRRQDIKWNEVISRVRKRNMERVLLLGVLLAHNLLGAPVPSAVKRSFADNPRVEKIGRSYSDRLFAPQSRHSKIEHTVTRLQLLDSLSDRLTYLWSRGFRTLSGG